MRKYIVITLTAGGDKTEEWVQWCKDHVADMIKLPGFIGGQAFRARSDFSFAHPEVLPTLPPYNVLTLYEVDEEGLQILTSKRRDVGSGPLAGTRTFPTPLGPYVGDSFLWEAISADFHAERDGPRTRKHMVMALSATGEKVREWADWARDHVAAVIKLPYELRSQAFRARPDYSFGHPESLSTRPAYDVLTLYEINDEGVELMTTTRREIGVAPQAGSRGFPTPLGPHLGDTYLWEAISPEYRAVR